MIAEVELGCPCLLSSISCATLCKTSISLVLCHLYTTGRRGQPRVNTACVEQYICTYVCNVDICHYGGTPEGGLPLTVLPT